MKENKNLELDENYSIEITTNDFYLKYEKKYLKDGKEVKSKNGWSFPDLLMALNKYRVESQKQDSFQEIYEATERVNQTIKNLKKNGKI